MLRNPSLTHLVTFVSVGRHLSFRRSADELMLNPGAISQQIQSLEKQIGCRSFVRSSKKVSFTEKGRIYLEKVAPLIQDLIESTQAVFGGGANTPLCVSVMPDFAERWLIPRLGSFYARYPQLVLTINASSRVVDFGADKVDIAIRHGLGEYAGVEAHYLFQEHLVPVCSPGLVRGRGKPSIGDLKGLPLLHDEMRQDWRMYLQALDVTDVPLDKGPQFNRESLMIQSAIEGHGIALVRACLVMRDLQQGRLVAPFDHQMPSRFAYYVVHSKRRDLRRTKVGLFKAWLISQAQDTVG